MNDIVLYKPDWEEAKQRFVAWWAGEVTDRIAMSVTAPNGKPRRELPLPDDPFRSYGDPEYLVEWCEANFSATYYAAEAFPCKTLLIGWAALGTPVTYMPNTIWAEHVIEDYDRDMPLFDTGNPAWQTLADVVKTLFEAGRDKWVTELPTVLDPTDQLSSLRGNDRLCMDLVDCPEKVSGALDCLTGIWFRAYGELGEMLHAREFGSTGWLPLWSPGMSTTIQCDFCCLIGPAMFERFVIPELQTRARWLDNCLYHLDGPEAVKHLDALLEIPEIKGIQWVPGAGQAAALDWPEVLRKVQNAGKLLHISIAADQVERALAELRPEGLFIATGCGSREEADELVKLARRRTTSRQG